MEPIVGDGQMNAGARVARLWEHLVALLQVRLRQARGDAKVVGRNLVIGIVFALGGASAGRVGNALRSSPAWAGGAAAGALAGVVAAVRNRLRRHDGD